MNSNFNLNFNINENKQEHFTAWYNENKTTIDQMFNTMHQYKEMNYLTTLMDSHDIYKKFVFFLFELNIDIHDYNSNMNKTGIRTIPMPITYVNKNAKKS